MRILYLSVLLLGLAAGALRAETVELVSCTDAGGRVVQGLPDPSLNVLVRAGQDGGRRVIRYNTDVLPELSALARQFFFAQECARVALGLAPGVDPPPARARQADCIGAATLRTSGALDETAALRALQAELVFSEDQWAQLPGPRRAFDLAACPARTGIALPLPSAPSEQQVAWNACIRQCGDRLLHCQGGCRGAACGDACLAAYDRCEAACRSR